MAKKPSRTPQEELKLLTEYVGLGKKEKAKWLKDQGIKATSIPYFKTHLTKLGMWSPASSKARGPHKITKFPAAKGYGYDAPVSVKGSLDEEIMRLGWEAKIAQLGGSITWSKK